ncbi:MAG: hypothetical protein QXJ62_01290 [Nitrososphaeria archaeon]
MVADAWKTRSAGRMKLYRKRGCNFCQLVESWTSFSINDKFYLRLCEEHNVPIIIYKYHNEPTDEEISEVLKWAEEKFPYLEPDFQRRHNPEHFAIELFFKTKVKIPHVVEDSFQEPDELYELFQILDEDDYED